MTYKSQINDSQMNFKQAITYATERLQQIQLQSAALEARILLGHVLNLSLEQLLVNADKILSPTEQATLLRLIDRRINLEPIAYIIGYKEFYGHKFLVNNHVLIPRPDSETLIDAVLALYHATSNRVPRIVDLGTGSGCIILTLLKHINTAIGLATDISSDALTIAKLNAKLLLVEERIEFMCSDWLDNVPFQKFDFIVSNPPYISVNEIDIMAAETSSYEPRLSLFAEDNGLSAYHRIALCAKNFLAPNGKLLLEIGFTQADLVSGIFATEGYKIDKAYQDLAGHIRVLCLTYSI